MKKKNKMWRGMLIGATTGAIISLLDKQTREMTKDNLRKVGDIVKNPDDLVKNARNSLTRTIKWTEDITNELSYWIDRADEMKRKYLIEEEHKE